MPWGLKRYQQSGNFHFLTFSCYRRKPKLDTAQRRCVFEMALERTRVQYRFVVAGYVVMPEHVHLLVGEPEVATLARALQSLKQSVSRTLIASGDGKPIVNMLEEQNFVSTATLSGGGSCQVQWWITTVVTNGTLDTTNTVGGFGSKSLIF